MRPQLIAISDLMQDVGAFSKEEFQREYPGLFLMTMGVLSAEVRARGDETSAVSFGSHRKHDVKQSHPLAGKVFFLLPGDDGDEGAVIGRGEGCELAVPEPSVSEKHCRVRFVGDALVATDLGSTNGTTVNLERVEPDQDVELNDEDILTMGRYSFQMMRSETLYSALSLLRAIEGEDG